MSQQALNTIRQYDYSDIEPYNDEKMRSVLMKLYEDEAFLEVMEYVYPDKTQAEIKAYVSKIETVNEFQAKIAYTAIKGITNNTATQVDFLGVENIDLQNKHVYISNHRDIILDSALFNVLLFERDIQTTETAIGDNLLGHPTVNALTKINKNFTVSRGLKGRELYHASMKLSNYILEAIDKNRTSIWISQREGRAKDGDDKTQKGLLKMLALSGGKKLIETFLKLNIRTLSISYEYDPCDLYKVKELLAREKNQAYVKALHEDKISIIAGITGRKGRVSFKVGKGIDEVLKHIDTAETEGELLNVIGKAIDDQIYDNYALWPNNYIALDQLNNTNLYTEQYSELEKSAFLDYMDSLLSDIDDKEGAQNILLKKYANPLINFLRI